ncbi:hypothetical protein IWW55_002325 [Coemansia sp. RSA 2706]|nr:hypothetical protein IWW55_002325 [Coemansia sp. RSA 2706]
MRPDPYKQKASRRYQAAHRDAAAKPPTPNSTVKDAPPPPEHKAGGKFSRRKIQDNAWRYEEMSLESTEGAHLDSLEAAEAREEEYVQEFLNHLDEKTQNIGTEQSAAYFQLRAEAASADLSAYNENVWKDLTKVDWEELVDTASSTPLHKLFGVDENTPLPDGVASTLVDKNDALLQNKPAQQNIQAPPLQSKSQPGTHIASTMLSAAELAPGISAANATSTPAAAKPVVVKPTAPPTAAAESNTVPKPPIVSVAPTATATASAPIAQKPSKPAQSVDELEAFLDEIL